MIWKKAIVEKIIDGDTLDVFVEEYGELRVRIIGIDTPEKYQSKKTINQAKTLNIESHVVEHLGRLSTTYTRHKLNRNSTIYLSIRGLDKYNRYLVWIKGFNQQIIKDGYAMAFNSSDLDHKIVKKLFILEKEAKANKKGFWAEIERSQLS